MSQQPAIKRGVMGQPYMLRLVGAVWQRDWGTVGTVTSAKEDVLIVAHSVCGVGGLERGPAVFGDLGV